MAEKKTNALQKPMTPLAELAAVVGAGQLSRGETVAMMWDYIKTYNLQNPANKREILANAKLKAVFDGKDKVSMFEMNRQLADHQGAGPRRRALQPLHHAASAARISRA